MACAALRCPAILEVMKIGCRCGALIRDQTDFLSYKAYLVADQDWFDVLDELATGSERRTLLQEASREMWQCTRCGVPDN
jgi:hypothetical protein